MSLAATRAAWARIEADDELSSPARLVLVVLADFANPKTGLCYPSVGKVVQRTGLGRSTVLSAIAVLEARGHLTVSRAGDGKSANHYAIPVQERDGSRSGTGPGAGRDRSRSGTRPVQERDPNQLKKPVKEIALVACIECDRPLDASRRNNTRCSDCQLLVDEIRERRERPAVRNDPKVG